jgi:hypothetical protein
MDQLHLTTRTAFVVVTTTLLLALTSCTEGKKPFRVVQFCVHDSAGAVQLINELKQLAATEHLEFFDSSKATEKDLKDIGYRGRERSDGSPMINVGSLRNDGLGVGGGNLGLPGYQVALGFSKGSDNAEAQRFADRVVDQLNRQWRVQVLPAGASANPKADCH